MLSVTGNGGVLSNVKAGMKDSGEKHETMNTGMT
jgi:hypothetical protein